jgi:hypothetical protein
VYECADAPEEEAPPTAAEEGHAEPTGMREIHEQLATCTTSERADEIAINFCLIQTKSALPSVTFQSLELESAWESVNCRLLHSNPSSTDLQSIDHLR